MQSPPPLIGPRLLISIIGVSAVAKNRVSLSWPEIYHTRERDRGTAYIVIVGSIVLDYQNLSNCVIMAFYKELNKLSTADFYVQNDKKRKVTTSSKDFFEIPKNIFVF